MQSPCLELGGKNPLVVMPDADLDLAAEGALFSGFGTAGQRCTSLGTVIVHESVHDEFMRRFTGLVEEAAIGDPFEDVLYGPMIHERFPERFDGLARAGPRPPHDLRLQRAPAGSRPTTRAPGSWAIPTPGCSATRRSSTA